MAKDAKPLARKVVIHPQKVVPFSKFLTTKAPAVALDGYVEGPTRYEKDLSHISFNHHEGNDRFATRATCEQVALALSGRPGRFWSENPLSIHVNDADADVCLSVWLLKNPGMAQNPNVMRLVAAEGCLDTTAGCVIPAGDNNYLEQVAWVFDPCFSLGVKADEVSLRQVLRKVGKRIDAFVAGRARKARHTSTYSVVGSVGRVAIVQQAGPLARAAMSRDGIDAYVLLRDTAGRHVSVGVTDPSVQVDLVNVYEVLNALENKAKGDRWGGATTVGGSPRRKGTSLNPQVVAAVMEAAWPV